MSTEPFIGEVKILGFNFAPVGYMTCQGQLLSIASYTAMFALIGTIYGGDGQVTFQLPDLRGRVPIGQGQGPGLPVYSIGEVAGINSTAINVQNMPFHNHPATGITVNIPVSTGGADVNSAAGAYLANTGAEVFSSVSTPGQNYGTVQLGGATGMAGGGQPFSIMNPYLTINYSIAVEGIFPSRN